VKGVDVQIRDREGGIGDAGMEEGREGGRGETYREVVREEAFLFQVQDEATEEPSGLNTLLCVELHEYILVQRLK